MVAGGRTPVTHQCGTSQGQVVWQVVSGPQPQIYKLDEISHRNELDVTLNSSLQPCDQF